MCLCDICSDTGTMLSFVVVTSIHSKSFFWHLSQRFFDTSRAIVDTTAMFAMGSDEITATAAALPCYLFQRANSRCLDIQGPDPPFF